MKKLLIIELLSLLALACTGVAQGSNPLRITCPLNRTNWVCGGSFAFANYPLPTTAGSCPTNATVTCSPPSGSTFILGTTTVNCRATNSCRESATCSFTLTVAHDTVPPLIQCPGNINATLCGTASTMPVTFPTPTVTDNADTNVAVACTPSSGSPFPAGTTTVTCTATDDCTNRSTCTFLVRVTRDTSPPVIQCPTNSTILTCSPTGAVVNFVPTATDNLDATPTVVCSPPSGSVFPLGTNVVVCTASDDCTNRRTCTFTVTVRPPLLYNGLCHSPLGRAALNVNTNDELEVSGLGTNGQDGVRIDLGESQGLRWVMKLPSSQDVDGRDFLIWQRHMGSSTAGTEILIGQMAYASRNGRRTITPSAASYEFKLLLRGQVVYQQSGRTGDVEIPECHHVEQEHCVGEEFEGSNPNLPYCINFLTVECDWDTPSGPVRADALMVTPEDPLPPFTAITSIEILGRDLPALTLHSERLLMFGSRAQPPLPHLALGQARLVAENGTLMLADLGSSGRDGVRVDLGERQGLHWRMDNPPGVPEGDLEIEVFGRTTAGTEVPLRRISHHYRGGRTSVTPGAGPYEFKLLLRGRVVFQQGGQTGDVDIPECHHVENEHCVGDPFAAWHPGLLPYCFNFLTVECDWETPTGVVRADTLVLTPEDPVPSVAAISAVQILGRNVRNLPVLKLHEERLLTFGGAELRLACPPNVTVRTCSTNPVPVIFPPPVVSGGNCTLPATIVCVPPSGSLFPPGPTTVQCTATNVCGERAGCSFTVTILRDITPPVITCPSNIVLGCLCTNQIIVLDFFQATATDDLDPNPSVVCNPPSLVSSPGVHPVVCTATDNCGNRASCTFTVTFLYDTTPPVIQCPGNLSAATCSNTVAVNYSVTTTDECSSTVTVVCVPPSGSQFPVGSTIVNCTATDRCDNRSECRFTVTVKHGLMILSEVEPNNALASAHDLGMVSFVAVVGRVSPAGDVDYYRFTAVPNSKAWITVDTGGAAWLGANSRDSVLTLYNGAGAVIESDDNDGSGNGADSVLESGDASAIAGAALAGGTHYLSVAAAAAGQIIAPYRLYITVTTNPIPPEVEANNTAATATPLVPPGLTYGVRDASLNPAGDEDWYTVSVPGPSLLHISVDGDPERDGTGTDTLVDLLRKDGVSILLSANSSAGGGAVAEGFVYRLSVPGTYYLRIGSASSAAVTGTYRVMVAHCPLPPPPSLGIVHRGGLVSLSWPAALEPCLVRSSRDLRTWNFPDPTPTFDGDQLLVELPSTPPHQFFQLAPAGGWSNDSYHCCDANGTHCSDVWPGLHLDERCGRIVFWCYETENSSECEVWANFK